MKKLTYVLAALSAFASFAAAPKLGELTDDSVVPAVSNSAEVVLSGDSISLRNPDAGTGLVISGVGSGIVVTNGATVYAFPERSGTVMLNGDEADPTVPAWAKEANPPASMPDNGLVLTNNGTTVKTKAGTQITASMVGAMSSSYTAPVTSVNTKTGAVSLGVGDIAGAASTTYVDQKNEQITAVVQTWEGFLDGSNVVFSITNYISGSYSLDTAKLRILEMTNGVYREVYNTRDEIVMHIADFETNTFQTAMTGFSNNVETAIANKADKAWGKYTSTGGEAPSNTVVMTETYTKFAGGTEYYRFAVGEGSIAVLATKGAPAYAVGDEGTFKFQDDGGTNYFGFAKSDSYVLGCNADGISVSSGIVTIRYDVVMPNYPCVWYKASLSSATPWEQLNLPDGTAIAGASHAVSWEQNPPEGQKLCYLNCSGEPQGFFKATIEVAGGAKFMTNMPAEFSAGIVCTNTSSNVNGVIVPTYNGSSVIWTWRAQ